VVNFVSFTFVSSWQKPAQNSSKSDSFLQKVAKSCQFMSKKCKKMLIFALIFTLKTNMSYKTRLYLSPTAPFFKISLKNLIF